MWANKQNNLLMLMSKNKLNRFLASCWLDKPENIDVKWWYSLVVYL